MILICLNLYTHYTYLYLVLCSFSLWVRIPSAAAAVLLTKYETEMLASWLCRRSHSFGEDEFLFILVLLLLLAIFMWNVCTSVERNTPLRYITKSEWIWRPCRSSYSFFHKEDGSAMDKKHKKCEIRKFLYFILFSELEWKEWRGKKPSEERKNHFCWIKENEKENWIKRGASVAVCWKSGFRLWGDDMELCWISNTLRLWLQQENK